MFSTKFSLMRSASVACYTQLSLLNTKLTYDCFLNEIRQRGVFDRRKGLFAFFFASEVLHAYQEVGRIVDDVVQCFDGPEGGKIKSNKMKVVKLLVFGELRIPERKRCAFNSVNQCKSTHRISSNHLRVIFEPRTSEITRRALYH